MRRRRRKARVLLLGALVAAAFLASLSSLPYLSPSQSIEPLAQPIAQEAPTPTIDVPLPAVALPSVVELPAKPTPIPPPETVNYIVLPGDTLLDLADQYRTTVEKLRILNDGLEPTRLRSGDIIKVPNLAARQGENQPRFIWPVIGYITTAFGERGSYWVGGVHTGLDIAGETGTTILTADEGVIVATNTDGMGRGYGTYVLIYHSDNWSTFYSHLSKVYHPAGYKVRSGEAIGEVGMTGFADGPHLHFEVWHDGEKLDPIKFLP